MKVVMTVNNVRVFRKKFSMNQVDLANKSGLSQSYICEIEKGVREPTLRTLKRLASALGVRVIDLLDDKVPMSMSIEKF